MIQPTNRRYLSLLQSKIVIAEVGFALLQWVRYRRLWCLVVIFLLTYGKIEQMVYWIRLSIHTIHLRLDRLFCLNVDYIPMVFKIQWLVFILQSSHIRYHFYCLDRTDTHPIHYIQVFRRWLYWHRIMGFKYHLESLGEHHWSWLIDSSMLIDWLYSFSILLFNMNL